MLSRLIQAVVIAVIVTLACMLLGKILGAIDLSITFAIGAFLVQFSAILGILAGLWHFFGGSLRV